MDQADDSGEDDEESHPIDASDKDNESVDDSIGMFAKQKKNKISIN